MLQDLLIFSVVAAIFYFVVWKNPKFQEWLGKPLGGGGEGGETTPGTGTGGAGAAGTCGPEACVYKVLESVTMEEHTGTRNYASGGSSPTYEAEVNQDWEQYAVVWYGTITNPDESDTITIKMNGDGHSDGKCCWYTFGLTFDGKTYWGAEKEHPSDNVEDDSPDQGKNVGSIVGKKIGIQVIFNRAASGQPPTNEAYVDVGNGWEQIFGPTPDPGGYGWGELQTPQNILVRIDNQGDLEKADCAQCHKIDPSTKQTPSTTTPPATTPPATTPPANGNGNEDEQEEENESNLAYALMGYSRIRWAQSYPAMAARPKIPKSIRNRFGRPKDDGYVIYDEKSVRKNPRLAQRNRINMVKGSRARRAYMARYSQLKVQQGQYVTVDAPKIQISNLLR
jgi:hypothetical protein